jgi:hypothetical protein
LINILEKWKGYLEIFGRKFLGKKGNFGLWRIVMENYGEGNYFFGSGNTELQAYSLIQSLI